MKTLKWIAPVLLMATAGLSAQSVDSNPREISFGVKGGVNLANVVGKDFNDRSSRTSFHVGALAEFPIQEIFSIQVEALYSGQGFEYDFRGPTGDKAEYQLDYINVPVLAKFYLSPAISIEVGPQFSFVVNEEFDSRPLDNSGDVDLTGTPAEAETFDFGAAAGLTFQTPSGFFASARYNHGFTDIIKEIDVQNSVFQIGLGYKF